MLWQTAVIIWRESALGIILFLIEISWFVVIPIFSEMKVWYTKRKALLPASIPTTTHRK